MKKPKRSVDWQERDAEPSERMPFDFDEKSDDEILELEDVLEFSEEETSFGAEAPLDDPDIDLADLELEFDSKEESFLEDDLTENFSFDEGKVISADSQQDVDSAKSELEDERVVFSKGFDDASFVSLDQEVTPDGRGETLASSAKETGEAIAEDNFKPSIEDFVEQIEARLIETVQQIVESRLPDIVRTLLQEEIERVKKELEADRA